MEGFRLFHTFLLGVLFNEATGPPPAIILKVAKRGCPRVNSPLFAAVNSLLRSVFLPVIALGLGAGSARAQVSVRAVGPDLTLVQDAADPQTVQADGKLLLTAFPAGTGRPVLRRYLPDGTLDPSFNPDAALDARGLDFLAALPSGETLAVGRFGAAPDAAEADPPVVVRLEADGSRDPAFPAVALPFPWVESLKPLGPGGGFLLGGPADAGAAPAFRLVRLDARGQLDPGYAASFPEGVPVRDWQVAADGGVFVALESAEPLLRLRADGSRDPAFRAVLPAGMRIDALLPLGDGRLLVAASPGEDSALPAVETLTRLDASGAAQPGSPATLPGKIMTLYEAAAGATLAEGDFPDAAGAVNHGLARIGPDGQTSVVFASAAGRSLGGIAGAPGGGFALSVNETAAGSENAALELRDADGALLERREIAAGQSAGAVLPRPGGGYYVDLYDPAETSLLVDGQGFSPPPAPGVSTIKAGPTVTISVIGGEGARAKFLLTRTGDLSADLKVTYAVKGNALPGEDYQALTGKRIIKAGRSTAKINVFPTGARQGRAVRLALQKRRAYNVGSPATAKVRLQDAPGANGTP